MSVQKTAEKNGRSPVSLLCLFLHLHKAVFVFEHYKKKQTDLQCIYLSSGGSCTTLSRSNHNTNNNTSRQYSTSSPATGRGAPDSWRRPVRRNPTLSCTHTNIHTHSPTDAYTQKHACTCMHTDTRTLTHRRTDTLCTVYKRPPAASLSRSSLFSLFYNIELF